jgi:hypothetical protein
LRLGHRKIGELAIASANLQLLSKSRLPWIDPDVVWRRCLATGQALEYLRPYARLGGVDEGLFLSAMLLPMSQVFAGLVFPDVYRRMIERCQATGASLPSLEHETFAFRPAEAMAAYLERSEISARLHKPLKHAEVSCSQLETITEPLRTKIEQLKAAANLAKVVVGRWPSWDEIDFLPREFMHRVGANQINDVVGQLREGIARAAPAEASGDQKPRSQSPGDVGEIRYFKLTVEPYDLLGALIEAIGIRPIPISREEAQGPQPVLVNCLDVSERRLEQFLEHCQPCAGRLMVGHHAGSVENSSGSTFVSTPCSFGSFEASLMRAVSGNN